MRQRLLRGEGRLLQREPVLAHDPCDHRLSEQQHERAAGAVLAAVTQMVEAVVARLALPALRHQLIGAVDVIRVSVVEHVQQHHLRARVQVLLA